MRGLPGQRPLFGMRVGLSVSESTDLARRGRTPAGFNRLTVRLSRALLAQGASLAFGHDWREDGIMDAISGSAIDSFGPPRLEAKAPLLLNLVPWPDSPRLKEDALLRMQGILQLDPAGLPADVAGREEEARHDPVLHAYLRSRGLTHLRRRLTGNCQARICLGGKEHGYGGRYPGVFEEALFALEASQPLYLVGLLGGVSERLGRAIEWEEPPPDGFGAAAFQATDGLPSLAATYAAEEQRTRAELPEDLQIVPGAAWEGARRLGRNQFGRNGLTHEENQRLLATTVVEEAILLIVTGLKRLEP